MEINVSWKIRCSLALKKTNWYLLHSSDIHTLSYYRQVFKSLFAVELYVYNFARWIIILFILCKPNRCQSHVLRRPHQMWQNLHARGVAMVKMSFYVHVFTPACTRSTRGIHRMHFYGINMLSSRLHKTCNIEPLFFHHCLVAIKPFVSATVRHVTFWYHQVIEQRF